MHDNQQPMDQFFDELDKEEDQEVTTSTVDTPSLIDRDRIDLVERETEYRDPEKQWVRENLWLEVAKRIAKNLPNGRGIRYLTLPAYYRLDVSLFLQQNLIEVTKTNQDGSPDEVYVAAFEEDEIKYGRMIHQRPHFKMFCLEKIEDVLTEPLNPYYQNLRDLFPFDVINLDLTSSLTPSHEGPYSKTMMAINTIFERQASIGSDWALFLTFRNMHENWHPGTLDQLFNNLQSNLDNHPEVRDKFINKYPVTSVKQLMDIEKERSTCISQAILKWLVDRAHYYGHKLNTVQCCKYQRYPKGKPYYSIYKQVLTFSKGKVDHTIIPTKENPFSSWMLKDLVASIELHTCKDIENTLLVISEKKPIISMLTKTIEELCGFID